LTKIKIIAEIGVNHNGSIKIAKKLIDVSKKAGADYVKFQTFKTNKLLNQSATLANYQKKNTKFKSTHDLLNKYEFTYKNFLELKNYCIKKKIKFLSTPFDLESLNILRKLKVNIIKISSGDFTNLHLIDKSLNFKKIILSTGLSDENEITQILEFIKKKKKLNNIFLLHCNTDYPTKPRDVNLLSMLYLKEKYNVDTGFSDHSEGITASIAAASLGAKIIEKHITLGRDMEGPDHKSSIEPDEFKEMVRHIRLVEKMLGQKKKFLTLSAKKNLHAASKSIYANKNIAKGEKFNELNMIVQRPGGGISPMKWFDAIGKISKYNFKKGDKIK